ncbi:hypothetical protein M7I_1054 [Glarea lozoyensis 74030]|uniref:Uncharacterized protein n=1 Tax=Glarea lozoyensis (strain ATCC 74030 / MF5533) TaxID=1104152 RepID=H0EF16_GLAL7|nr:hypothetical protein M7I_1054 [Glarea lozoyensis 74030]
MAYQYANFPSSTPLPTPSAEGNVTITTTSVTDIWRKPPSIDSFNAPIIYKKITISKFKSARVTVTANLKTLYDQGGLVLVFPTKRSDPRPEKRWVKTGFEYYQNRPMMSTVTTDLWSDWSLLPLDPEDEREKRVTVEVEREKESDGSWGSVLRVSVVGRGGKVPVREVTWAFWDVDEEGEILCGVKLAWLSTSMEGLMLGTFFENTPQLK